MAPHARLASLVAGRCAARASLTARAPRLARCHSTSLQTLCSRKADNSTLQSEQALHPVSPRARYATNATATAPNSKAYIESGVIAGAQNLVNVKKVLVIGSGGLAIGQAGEFDYSGKPI